jgi:excisionase family DNA binding protein
MINSDNPIIADVKEMLDKAVTDQQAKYTWFDINGACAYSKCSRVTIMRAIKNGDLKSAKPKGVNSLKFRRDWLDNWLNN